MSNSKTIAFPTWDGICKRYIEKYEKELDLSDGFHEHFVQQFRILKENLFTPQGGIKKLHSREFQDNKKDVLVANDLHESQLITMKLQDQLGANQFLTLYNSRADNFEWIDERVQRVLDIPKDHFSIGGIRGFNKELNLYHPMDVLHLMRYGTLAYLVNSLKGVKLTAMKDFYSITFRMGQNIQGIDKCYNQSTKLVERRCYPVQMNFNGESADQNHSSIHLDVWTIFENAENHKYVTPKIEIVGNPKMTKFLGTLFYIYNAMVLGFNPKDLTVLHFIDNYDQPEECRSSLNRAVRKLTDVDVEFGAKAFTDFSYSLNKKLTKSLILHSLNGDHNSSYYNRLNRLSKARSLGLLPISNEFNDLILSEVKAY